MFIETTTDNTLEIVPASSNILLQKRGFWQVLPWDFVFLGIVVIASLVLHFLVLAKPPTIVWDEVWYVKDAQSIFSGAGDLRIEHPALSKLFIIAGMHLFGDNAFGWRFFSVIIGVPAIVIFFFICRSLNVSRLTTVIATFLFALDDMYFVHAGLALLDIYMLTFMLLGLLFYLKGGYLMAGIAIAVSALCKSTGIFGFAIIFAHWILFRRDKPNWMLGSIFSLAISYLALNILFEYFIQGKLVDPIKRTIDMLNSNAANVFTNPALSISSRPWEWVLPWKIIIYAFGNAPEPQYISFISWTIQLLIIPVFIYLIVKAFKRDNAARLALMWFIFSYLIWFLIDAVGRLTSTPTQSRERVTFVFYFLPVTGSVCIGIALAIKDIIDKFWRKKIIYGRMTRGGKIMFAVIVIYLLLHLAIFIIFNPNFPTIINFGKQPFASFSSWANFFP